MVALVRKWNPEKIGCHTTTFMPHLKHQIQEREYPYSFMTS
jgi:hypothetical protein